MDKATTKLLTKGERELIAETSPGRLAKLDTDELLELHSRVRRARNKYLTLHRRQAGEQVQIDGSRGVAAQKNQRTSTKAEVFEGALSAVSAQLAAASKKSAARLRKDRLAAARPVRKGAAKKGGAKGSGTNRAARRGSAADDPSRTNDSSKRKGDRAAKSPASKKATASSRAAAARRQAKKDAR
jgi:hypothetical protein